MQSPHVPAMWTDTPFQQKNVCWWLSRSSDIWEHSSSCLRVLVLTLQTNKTRRKFYGWNRSGLKTRRESSPTLIFRWIGGLLTYPDLNRKQRNDQTWGCEAESFPRWKEDRTKKRWWDMDHSWVHEISWAWFLVMGASPVARMAAKKGHNNSHVMLLVPKKIRYTLEV